MFLDVIILDKSCGRVLRWADDSDWCWCLFWCSGFDEGVEDK